MSDRYISSIHIQKLGHKLGEIRERALHHIISKLEHGFVYDNDLGRSKEILSKLFEWFLFDRATQQEAVLRLILRILKSESGAVLISHYGPKTIEAEIRKIRSNIDPKYYILADEILQFVHQYSKLYENVPPLQSELPLSFRSQESERTRVGTTATTLEGFVHQKSTADCASGVPQHCTPDLEDNDLLLRDSKEETNLVINFTLKWQNLIPSDNGVLSAIENSLRNPLEPAHLLNSLEFFNDVILQDFPAEVFLQRPYIVQLFYDYLKNPTSTRLTNLILNCLLKLTKQIIMRISYYEDPCMHNSKEIVPDEAPTMGNYSPTSGSDTARSYIQNYGLQDNATQEEQDMELLKSNQMSLPCFCFTTMHSVLDFVSSKSDRVTDTRTKRKNCYAVNLALTLFNEVIVLLSLCLKPIVLEGPSTDPLTPQVLRQFDDFLKKFANVLDYFRLEVNSNDSDKERRSVQMYLLCTCASLLLKFVPLKKGDVVLPRNFKNALANILVDSVFARLYPEVHETVLLFVKEFGGHFETTSMSTYRDVKIVCNSMSSYVRFSRHHKTMQVLDAIKLTQESMQCLEFHRNFNFISDVVSLFANQLPLCAAVPTAFDLAEDVILHLLGHVDREIQEETYRLCHARILTVIGTKSNPTGAGAPGSQILFLLRATIFAEIGAHGLRSENIQVRKYSDEILVHLLKCKILVTDVIWNQVVEALITSFPILICHATKDTPLGRTIIDLLEPDSVDSYLIPQIEIVKGNLRLLFIDDGQTRMEAVSRLMWLLGSQTDSRNLLPRVNTLHNKSLESLCQVQRILDLNRTKMMQHYYQPSALIQVLDLLNSENVEPVIRRSALTQISVMMEDILLHNTFLERNGVAMISEIMKSALIENSYKDYVDCIVSAVSVLKNICLYNSNIRQQLSNNIDIYFYTLRGLFIFCAEERTRLDCSTFLCLLLFDHYILGAPNKADFSLPAVVVDKLRLPFSCKSHWTHSCYCNPSLASLLEDKCCASSIQIHWNSEFFGGFKKIQSWNEVAYSEESALQFSRKLWLKNSDLAILKCSSLNYCLNRYLTEIQNATSHITVIECFIKLQFYLHFYVLTKDANDRARKDVLTLPWEYSLSRFLSAPPANEEDTILLTQCLKLLAILVPLYTAEDKSCWVIKILKDSSQCLPNLLLTEFTPEQHELASLNRELLNLVAVCVWHEQQFFDLHVPKLGGNSATTGSWFYLVKIVADNLKFSNGDPFYNLAHLDSVLSCLVHLTSAIGWSCSRNGNPPKEPIPGMILDLCELVGTFHCGKGALASISLMGVSITRYVFLILNHLMAELQFFSAKNWEMCFVGESVVEMNLLGVVYTLLSSRDVVLRAAIWQLLAGLSMSSRASVELVKDITDARNSNGIWEMAMATVLDYEEASIVKENAASLLTNLTSHSLVPGNDHVMFTCLTPTSSKENDNIIDAILYILDDFKFYSELESILSCLYLKIKCSAEDKKNDFGRPCSARLITKGEFSFMYTKTASYERSPDSATLNSSNRTMFIAPSFVGNLTGFLQNLLIMTQNEIIGMFQEHSLVKLFFRCLSSPPNAIEDTKDLSLYCDVLEMNASICSFITKTVGNNHVCLGMVLQTRDCLNVMLSLLNPDLYLTNLSQLVYLRNRLWTEIFVLIAALLDGSSLKISEDTAQNHFRTIDALSIISCTLNECGHRPFLQTLCEAISANHSADLQQSALSSLTSLLRIESNASLEDFRLPESTPQWISIQDVLDTYRTPRTPASDENVNECEYFTEHRRTVNIMWQKKTPDSSARDKSKLLSKAYFGKLSSPTRGSSRRSKPEEEGSLMAGAELCRILLHLYDISNLKTKDAKCIKKKAIVVNTLTSILCVSREAKKLALDCGLVEMVVEQFQEVHVKLSLESVECLRRANDKKRVCPVLRELGSLVGLITNFMLGDKSVKCALTHLGFADLVHKLWIWLCVERVLLNDALRMLCTYTTDCHMACQALPATSSAAGSGPRKAPSNLSLLHEVFAIVSREMDLVSRMHDLNILELSFHLLHNACAALECRTILVKSNLLQCLSRLHPAITKRQKPWDSVELIWLEFLLTLTAYSEGQAYVAKTGETLDLVMMFALNSRLANKRTALLVLRNIAFFQQNRPKLLTSDDFLNILQTKLSSGNIEDQNIIVTIIWALSANSQRAKLVLRCAGLDVRLQECLKRINLAPDEYVDKEIVDRMHFVYSILKESEKTK